MKKTCEICGEEYECYDKAKSGSRRHQFNSNSSVRYKRPSNSKTCSRECSKIYQRKTISRYTKEYQKRKKLEKQNAKK